MDSLTQAVLGAAVGEATLGRKVGRKALGWGALAGTLPDLDIVAYPFLDPVGELVFHRGPTHALLFAPLVAPLLGYAVWRLYRARSSPAADVGWRGWTALFFWCLFTHPLLDTLTVYGTQLFRPFSDLPAAVPALFIIDPLFTLPLIVAVVGGLIVRDAERRWRLAVVGLTLSTLYAGWALGVKAHVERVVARNIDAQGIAAERFMTSPAPFQTLLWNVIVDVDDAFLVGTYGLLDDDDGIAFRRVEQQADRFEPYRTTRAGETLLWFSRGYFVMRDTPAFEPEDAAEPLGLVFNDIRFGRADGWLTDGDSADYIFPFRLVRELDGAVSFRLGSPSIGPDAFPALFRRILGDEGEADRAAP
ncbi:MAG: metal-dependent hydrolase [Rhodothermales bacterium]